MRFHGRRWLAAGCLAILFSSIVAATLPDYGVTWDERLYLEAGTAYVDWLANPSIETIDEYWSFAHPPIRNILGGLTHRLFHERLGLMGPIGAFRLAAVPFVFLLSFFLFLFAAEIFGSGIALAVAATFFLMPRVFFHAHVGTLDYAITALMFCACFAYWKSFERRGWLAAAGILLGLAVATRIDAGIALAPMAVLFAIRAVEAHPSPRELAKRLAGQIPLLLLPPLVFAAVWPWLWPDPIARVSMLVGSQFAHFQIPTLYFGKAYAEAPFHYPFTMMALTTPVVALLAAGVGLLRLRKSAERAALAFIVAGAMTPLFAVAFPGVPKSGGVRHFLAGAPFLCLLAGAGLREIGERLRRPAAPRVVVAGYLACLALTTVPALVRIHPYEVAYFNSLIGGYRGAFAKGFDLDYWGGSYLAAIPWMNDHPDRTYWLPLAPRLGGYYQETGALDAGVRLAGKRRSDTLVVFYRPSFFDREMRRCFERPDPLFAAGPPGVDLVRICDRRAAAGRAARSDAAAHQRPSVGGRPR